MSARKDNANHPATTTLAAATDIHTARVVMAALKEAGWIVVRHDAIRLAQAMAREEAKEDRRATA